MRRVTSVILRIFWLTLASAAALLLIGSFFYAYIAFAIGGQLSPKIAVLLLAGSALTVVGLRSARGRPLLSVVTYGFAALSVWLLVTEGLRLEQLTRERSQQAQADYRKQMLQSAVRVQCENGDVIVLSRNDSGANIILVPQSTRDPVISLAWADAIPRAPGPRRNAIDSYISKYGDCGNAEYPSLHSLFDELEAIYRQEHPQLVTDQAT